LAIVDVDLADDVDGVDGFVGVVVVGVDVVVGADLTVVEGVDTEGVLCPVSLALLAVTSAALGVVPVILALCAEICSGVSFALVGTGAARFI